MFCMIVQNVIDEKTIILSIKENVPSCVFVGFVFYVKFSEFLESFG